MDSWWHCAACGPVEPLSVASRASPEVLKALHDRLRAATGGVTEPVPLWCPWPLPDSWTVTGVAWAGDDRRAPRATALAVSGPSPLQAGPADLVFVAEEPGVGLGGGLGGVRTVDPSLTDAVADAKVRAGGHPTPLWSVPCGPDRSVHVGEARAMWLYVIGWPAAAAYLLMDGIRLQDLGEWVPSELVYGADSARLRPAATPSPGAPGNFPEAISGEG